MAGLISSVDRRINKKSGNPWAIVTLEDLDASVEVLFFPKVYSLYTGELAGDVAVSVKGRLNERDGTVSIFAQDHDPARHLLSGLGIRATAGHRGASGQDHRWARGRAQTRAARSPRYHPGAPEAGAPGRNPLLIDLSEFSVEPSNSFMADIKSLLGAAALVSS